MPQRNPTNGRFDPETYEECVDKFWAKVVKTDTCWLWTGYIAESGYGNYINRHFNSSRPHIIAFELIEGLIPDGLELDHVCKIKSCVRPHEEHVEAVSHTINVRRSSVAKLTDQDVAQIRFLCAVGVAQAAVAKQYEISQPTVSKIKNRKLRV